MKDYRNGRGRFNFKEGGYYEGEWVRDMKEGQGVLVNEDGTKIEGVWKRDQILSS